MNYNENDFMNSFTEQDWPYLLFLLLVEDIKNKNETWEDFSKELIYNNRFSCNHPIIDEIRKRKEAAIRKLSKGTHLYRARTFRQGSFDKIASYFLQEGGMSKADAEAMIKQFPAESRLLTLLPHLYDNAYENQSSWENIALMRAQKKWKKNVKFKGFSKKDSSAPPADAVKAGRANPDHIRYLYLAEDDVTPIYEIRPIIGQTVSVAKFELLRDIKVYDMTLDISDNMGNEDNYAKWPSLYNTIGEMFSRPHTGDESTYIPTQYLAEEIKKLGFDGVRFYSSLRKGGVNIVLFNPDDCVFVNKKVLQKGVKKVSTFNTQ